ncbi:MAG: M48 family metalloprotease [Chlamydiota bacterium]
MGSQNVSLQTPSLLAGQQEVYHHFNEWSWFTPSNDRYIEGQTGCYKYTLLGYKQIYLCATTIVSSVSEGFSFVVRKIYGLSVYMFSLLNKLSCRLFEPISHCMGGFYNTIYPINPADGKRHFTLISRGVERWLGDNLFYPQLISSHKLQSRKTTHDGERMSNHLQNILDEIVTANRELFNPKERAQFHYRTFLDRSEQLNAYAVPGGGICVGDRLVDAIERALQEGTITHTDIRLPDDSVIRVAFSNPSGGLFVTSKDVLAALLGHEGVHIAVRDGIVTIVMNFVMLCLRTVATFFTVYLLQKNDSTYQEIKNKPSFELTPEEWKVFRSKEEQQDAIRVILELFGKFSQFFIEKARSRNAEFRADGLGMLAAHNAKCNLFGALWLQAFLEDIQVDSCLNRCELFLTHPPAQKRLLALLMGAKKIAPEFLRQHATVIELPKPHPYCSDNALKFCEDFHKFLGSKPVVSNA